MRLRLSVRGRARRAVLASPIAALVAVASASAAGLAGEVIPVTGSGVMYDVACPVSSPCVAVGVAPQNFGGLIWYRGKIESVPGTQTLSHIDCPAANYCIAVGEARFTGRGAPGGAIVQISHGKVGKVESVPENLLSIGCDSASSCWAPGNMASANGPPTEPLVAHIVGGRVAGVIKVNSSYPYLFSAGEAGGAVPSCTHDSCVIVGKLSDNGPGAVFSLAHDKVTRIATVPGTTALSGLACFSAVCRITGFKQIASRTDASVLTLRMGRVENVQTLKDAYLGPLDCLVNKRCFAFGNTGSYPKITPIVLTIDNQGKLVVTRPIAPNIFGVFCSHTCIAAGQEGQYPKIRGVLFDKFVN